MKPQKAADVSVALRILYMTSRVGGLIGLKQAAFAIKGGGHTPWKGSSSVEDGITIDLAEMDAVELNDAKSVVSVGPGARWIDVYENLDPMGLSVSGGRVADVGVAGYVLGGKSSCRDCDLAFLLSRLILLLASLFF